jgi:CRISPR type III-A-associated protein Csm2
MKWDEWVVLYKGGYFDEAGYLRREFVLREPVDDLARQIQHDGPGLTRTQARRFFQHCRRIEQRLKVGKLKWEAVRADVLKLDEVAADSISRDQPKIPRRFHDFIMHNVRAIQSERDFLEGFMRHFEALVAFGYGYFKKDRGGG